MNTIKLGNDFTDENSQESSSDEEVKQPDDESGDEKENSADTSDSETTEETGESTESDEESTEETEEETEVDEDTAALQGLEETEKKLLEDNSEIDSKITAARERIKQLRYERREKRDLVETVDEKFPDNTDTSDDLSDIDAETIKVLERFTRAKGLVPKSEMQKMTYQQQHKIAEELFYEKHPEYLPENDSDDTLYLALKKELSYFAAPTDTKLISKLFDKAHSFVRQQYPDRFKGMPTTADSDKATSAKVRLKTSGLGGNSGGTAGKSEKTDSGKKPFSSVQIRALEDGGWTPEEIEQLNR